MNPLSNFYSQMESRNTPQGRQFEAKIIAFDCNVLILGVIGLAISFPPLVYIGAVGHIVANFRVSPVKWVWAMMEISTIVISTAMLAAATYATQVYYFGTPSASVVGHMQAHWHQLTATAIVAAGLIGKLFAHPGIVYQYIEKLDCA